MILEIIFCLILMLFGIFIFKIGTFHTTTHAYTKLERNVFRIISLIGGFIFVFGLIGILSQF